VGAKVAVFGGVDKTVLGELVGKCLLEVGESGDVAGEADPQDAGRAVWAEGAWLAQAEGARVAGFGGGRTNEFEIRQKRFGLFAEKRQGHV
jgi:hypothetical protein